MTSDNSRSVSRNTEKATDKKEANTPESDKFLAILIVTEAKLRTPGSLKGNISPVDDLDPPMSDEEWGYGLTCRFFQATNNCYDAPLPFHEGSGLKHFRSFLLKRTNLLFVRKDLFFAFYVIGLSKNKKRYFRSKINVLNRIRNFRTDSYVDST